MNAWKITYQVALADFLERTRRFSFLVTLGLTILAAYLFVPPSDAGYVTLYFEEFRGIYNSAWVGGTTAVSTSLFLSFFGFFLVRNGIERDKRTRVGQIIEGSSLKKSHYLLGKALSNFLVLAVIAAVVIPVAICMQWVRGEDYTLHVGAYLAPYLFVVIPALAVVSAMAVLFETRPVLRSPFGIVLYLLLFTGVTMSTLYSGMGNDVITKAMREKLMLTHADYEGTYGQGILFLESPLKLFVWDGISWTWDVVIKQAALLLVAVLVCLLASRLFRGFKENTVVVQGPGAGTAAGQAVPARSRGGRAPAPEQAKKTPAEPAAAKSPALTSAAELTPVRVNNRFLPLVGAEFRLQFAGFPPGWYVVAVILALLCLFLPFTTALRWIWPLAWIWPISLWSSMGNREYQYGTLSILASSPGYIRRQIPAVWLSGFLAVLLTGSGMLIRFIVTGDVVHLIYAVAAAFFVPSFALALGIWTESKRPFELIYMLLWFLGPFNQLFYADFMGTAVPVGSVNHLTSASLLIIAVLLAASVLLVVAAYSKRKLKVK
ncbi:Tat pathway signal protein [Paenibacillus chitinolyticus]|uniref:Tat pathway signal protein n=1 Tax=Paenibacillus chitinolyticus TaxID=79263 RepID=UPI001C4492D8|nr:Tat pathway signal protein [Paenibacillus chitinolyticus]MBV6715097.1 Tat pathway signal protein [Paenibacillus chitinolyticus]